MEKIKSIFQKSLSLKWYYQLAIILAILVLVALLITFLLWFVPHLLKLVYFIAGIFVLLLIFTEGKIVTTFLENYKQSKQVPTNPLFMMFYHYLTEKGVSELPAATMQFTQGVEFPDVAEGLYFIHLEKIISDDIFDDFELKVRQAVKIMSNNSTDCVVSRSKREPFLAIKVRLVSSEEMLLQNHADEEDF